MIKVKLAALDMDGTLLTNDLSVLPETVSDLKAAYDRGMQYVYSSGRAVPEVQIYQKELPFIRYGVCMNGAAIYDFHKNKCLFRKTMKREVVREIIEVSEKMDGMLQFLFEDASIADAGQISRMEDYCAKALQPLFEQVAIPVTNMREEAERLGEIPKINVFFSSPAIRDSAFECLKTLPVSMAYSGKTSIEITAGGLSKALGLTMLAEQLGVKMEEVFGIGDAINDLEVLKICGISAAMGNAIPKIKEVCDFITEDNEHNGAGLAIRKVLNGEV